MALTANVTVSRAADRHADLRDGIERGGGGALAMTLDLTVAVSCTRPTRATSSRRSSSGRRSRWSAFRGDLERTSLLHTDGDERERERHATSTRTFAFFRERAP